MFEQSSGQKVDALRRALLIALPYTPAGGSAFTLDEPFLALADLEDKDLANSFVEVVFRHRLCKWIEKGEAAEPLIHTLAQEVKTQWVLSEGAAIGQVCAYALKDGRRILAVLYEAMQAGVTESTDLSAYDDVTTLIQSLLNTSKECGLWEIVGQSIGSAPHWHKLCQKMAAQAKAVRAHAPAIQSDLLALQDMAFPSGDADLEPVRRILESIPKYVAAMPTAGEVLEQ